jgi:serine/threonine protein kinase
MALPDPLGLVGVKLGPYIVRESITEGGVAVIYRGEHESLQSAVAVKVLMAELVSEDIRPTLEQMFLREAQILSQLRSEDILRALDHGRVVCPADGIERPYIVVDYLVGRPLSDDLEQRAAEIPPRPYTLLEAIELSEPIVRALSVCHASGIVHRDVNPRNVFLEETGTATPRAKLIDFGFAKEVYRTEALRLEDVSGTLFARSPDYAAPEHYDREKYGELSETTDTYTLALMIVEMLTLERPLRGVTDTDLWLATTDETDRPTPRRRGAQVSDAVEALFAEAVAVDQLKRPQVLTDWWARVVAASRPILGSEDLGARSPSLSGADSGRGADGVTLEELTARRRLPRHRSGPGIGTLFAGLMLLVVAVLGAGLWWRARPLECPQGFADCNGQHADGCETPIDKDPSSCGACGTACPHASGVGCVQGQCRITACPANQMDCNKTVSDGCEIDVHADLANCGACGTVCGTDGTKSAGCVEAKCLLTCKPGLGDCDGATANGCETPVWKDPKNCGRCGTACAEGTACVEGLCAPQVLVSGVQASHLTARAGSLYYWDEDANRIARVSAGEKPVTVVTAVNELTGLAWVGDRLAWATKAGIVARSIGDPDAPVERISGPLNSDSPLVASPGFVAWAQRAAPVAKRREAKHPDVMPDKRRVVASAGARGKPSVVVECNEWPRTFAADDHDVYCCDDTTPLAAVTCEGAKCTHRDFDVSCPSEIALDTQYAYLSADVRVMALDRRSSALTVLAKRKRHPRDVTLAAGNLYWLEAERPAELYRLQLGGAAATPELVARRLVDVTSIAADETAVYWVAAVAGGGKNAETAIYALPLGDARPIK